MEADKWTIPIYWDFKAEIKTAQTKRNGLHKYM